MWICKWCKQNFNNLTASAKANHSRWCKLNPIRSQYSNNMNLARKAITLEGRKRQSSKIKIAWRAGKFLNADVGLAWRGKHLSKEFKEKLSLIARNNPYQRVCKTTILYKGIKLDSKYELMVAKILDELKIKWVRPKPLLWIDKDNKHHNYFADFYLIDHNIYLDPKNDYCFKVQKEKIDYIKKNYKNVIFLNANQLNAEYILSLW